MARKSLPAVGTGFGDTVTPWPQMSNREPHPLRPIGDQTPNQNLAEAGDAANVIFNSRQRHATIIFCAQKIVRWRLISINTET